MAVVVKVGLTVTNGVVTAIADTVTWATLTYKDSVGSCYIRTNLGNADQNIAVAGINLTSAPSVNFKTLTIGRDTGFTLSDPVLLGGFANSKIEEVSINDVKVELQPKAFMSCQQLTSINLTTAKINMPTSLESWPKWVFYGCINLTQFTSGVRYLTGNIKRYVSDSTTFQTLLFVAPGGNTALEIRATAVDAIAPTACASCGFELKYYPYTSTTYIGEGAFYAASAVGYDFNIGTLKFGTSNGQCAEIHSYAFEYVGWNRNIYYEISYGNSSTTNIFIESRAFARMKINNFILGGYDAATGCKIISLDYPLDPEISPSDTATYKTQSWFYGVSQGTGKLQTYSALAGGLEDIFTNFFYNISESTKMTTEQILPDLTLLLTGNTRGLINVATGATPSSAPHIGIIYIKCDGTPSSSTDYDVKAQYGTSGVTFTDSSDHEVNQLTVSDGLAVWWSWPDSYSTSCYYHGSINVSWAGFDLNLPTYPGSGNAEWYSRTLWGTSTSDTLWRWTFPCGDDN